MSRLSAISFVMCVLEPIRGHNGINSRRTRPPIHGNQTEGPICLLEGRQGHHAKNAKSMDLFFCRY